MQHKLISLGIRKGQLLSVLHQRQNGVVVSSFGNRVAIGKGMAAKIFVLVDHDSTSCLSV